MSKGKSEKIVYKSYEQDQAYLIPPSAEELIPENHLVRLVSEVVDEMGIAQILMKYRVGGGASRYHPAMMTKLFVYGYMTKVCSSRMLAKAVRENVMFMWLAGGQRPDFRTLNEFRGKILKEVMEEIFVTAVKMLKAKGYIKLEHYFVDGTKIESASGRYTFVWKKSVEKNDKKLDEKLRAYIRMADDIWEDENQEYGKGDLEELGGKEGYTSKDVKELAGILRERIEHLEAAGEEEGKKKLKRDLKVVETDYLVRKKKYEKVKRICGKRNSYSKTDPDATFMRMKEDHMGNGQLKPGYNVQIGTENGFVTGYDIFPNPTDTRTLKPHLKRQKKRFGMSPKAVIADAGYGSEENYQYLENRKSAAVIKYAMFQKEQTRKWKADIWKVDNWRYDAEGKYYVCPNGKHLTFRETRKRRTDAGYPITIEKYECESCKYCRMKKLCTKAKGNRRIERNENWLRLRAQARKTLEEEPYRTLRKQRAVEVETVFGQIKGNQGFRRFLLRGTAKVSAEWGLFEPVNIFV
ncbi:transposase [Spirochaetia bacterium]|nr:transposase [Spirochaetia bacterium]